MFPLRLAPDGEPLRILCMGAHSDDIEIGCAATLLRWMGERRRLQIVWAVASAPGCRADEARRSAEALLAPAEMAQIVVGDFQDSYLPAEFGRAKEFVSALRDRIDPHVVMTHRLDDRHQDHRLLSELAWQTWRDHLILEYEIPKYEGEASQSNMYVTVERSIAEAKAEHLSRHFGSQRSKDWFTPETFLSVMRLRGLECRSASGFAEGFVVRKAVI
jgi:LmbE family N-acetylglucosaminyl deacetylase